MVIKFFSVTFFPHLYYSGNFYRILKFEAYIMIILTVIIFCLYHGYKYILMKA